MARIILNICHWVEDSCQPWQGTFVPPIWLSCYDNWVCGLKSNIMMVPKLIKHRKKREPDQSTRKLTACLIQALRARNSLSQACLVLLSFWDTVSFHKEGPEGKKHLNEIKCLRQLEDKFLVEHLNNLQHIFSHTKNKLCKVFSWVSQLSALGRFQVVGWEETILDRFEHYTQCYL